MFKDNVPHTPADGLVMYEEGAKPARYTGIIAERPHALERSEGWFGHFFFKVGNDVVFAVDGKSYDTLRMRRFDVPGIAMAVFVNEDARCAFVQTVDHAHGVVVHRATSTQLRFIANSYDLPELLSYLPLTDC